MPASAVWLRLLQEERTGASDFCMPQSPHIFRAHDEALTMLDHDIRRMGQLALQNLQHATDGLLQRDDGLCNRAIADDGEVDELEKKIDHTGMEIIIRFGPKAADLRRVIASMKVSTALERISDHCVSLARRARRINERPMIPETEEVRGLAALAAAGLRDSITSYCDGQLDLALRMQTQDLTLDEAHQTFTQRIIARLETDSSQVNNYVDLLFAVRFLERIGDQSVNIAEDTVYLLTALDIRHGGKRPGEP